MSRAPDVIAVLVDPRRDELRRRLDDLLTRSFYSAAGYVFESDPYVVPADDDVLSRLATIREQDRRHAHVLGTLIAARGGVPAAGVFPWWNLDLNFLTVPTMGRFVVEALTEELGLFDALIARWSADDEDGRAALRAIRNEKGRQVADLGPVVEAAILREGEEHRAKAAAVKKVRDARIAKEKAAAEAAKKAKAAARPGAAPAAAGAPAAAAAPTASAAIGDPLEPGISKKEKGRRALLRIRQKLGLPMSLLAKASAPSAVAATAVTAPAPAAPAAGGALLDPNEPGISPKEKARRQMAKSRAASGAPAIAAPAAPAASAPSAPASVPAPAGAAPAAELLDPNEAGISPKEKARRQMLKVRAAAGGGASPAPAVAAAPPAAAPPAPAAAAVAATAPGTEALPADLGDPNEPGLSPKEKARRQMARMRARR